MKAEAVIEGFNVIEQDQFGLTATFWNLILEAFGFESGKKALHYGVVVWIGFAAHGSARAMRVQKRLKLSGGVLDAAIRMVEKPRSELLLIAGFLPRSDD